MKFIYGNFSYDYDLIRQNRKTLSLTVDPNLHITLKVPNDATGDEINKFLKKKWLWLEKQIGEFKKYKKKKYEKEYVAGESFLYLGKEYTLAIDRGKMNHIDAFKGRLLVNTIVDPGNTKYTKVLIERWYRDNRRVIFRERLSEMMKKFDNQIEPKLNIRDMQRRWGSFIGKETILLNPKLIFTSIDCIDYVITHELCHLVHKNHSEKFYSLLEKKFPNWKKTKIKLESYNIS